MRLPWQQAAGYAQSFLDQLLTISNQRGIVDASRTDNAAASPRSNMLMAA
jgi:hypothetical protein